MKKLIAFALLLTDLIAAVFLGVCNASQTFYSDSKTIVVSTTPASPTQLLTQTNQPNGGAPFIQKNVIFNPTGFNLYISTSNVTISTGSATGNAFPFIPPMSVPFDLDQCYFNDQNSGVYQGQLYGVLAATSTVGGTVATPQPVSVIRFR